MEAPVKIVVRRASWWDRLWAANPLAVDGVISLLLLLTSLGSMAGPEPHQRDADLLGVALLVAAHAVLAFRRRAPMRVFVVVMLVAYALFARSYGDTALAAVVVAVWTAATREPHPRINVIANGALPLVPIAWLLDTRPSRLGDAVATVITVVITALLGYSTRLRREKRAQEARTEHAETERAVSEERLRIARELHDVVAHAMSVVAVQAGVAAHVIDDQPDEAKRMLENVRVTSHEALDEMRRLLGVLRGGDAALAPAPGLDDLGALAESMRESGVPVDVAVAGTAVDVPGGVQLTAYRIVQEALTNVLKHAGPARVEVRVRFEPGLVVVEVDDDGRGGSVRADGGHGIQGMRERVAVFGGVLSAGPKPGGGFRVRATLPHGA